MGSWVKAKRDLCELDPVAFWEKDFTPYSSQGSGRGLRPQGALGHLSQAHGVTLGAL